jgi:predicted MPP superfamily phosphohydrolase
VRIREIELAIPGLPRAFDGYRIAQISDLHIGSFDPKSQGLRWAKLTNAQNADLTVVTGDLVTSGTEFYEDASDVLAALRARDGVFVSMGNHDQWDNAKFTSILEQRNVSVLKNESRVIRRNDAAINVAALDDAYTGRANMALTLERRTPELVTILLAHYPSFFDAAAAANVQLTLAGHTHGGQLGIPFFGDRFNISTLRGEHARGVYRKSDSALYVNAGLGTTGPPMRIGVPPEIAVIVLRCA